MTPLDKIEITLSVEEWNIVVNFLNRIPSEPRKIAQTIVEQAQGKTESVPITLSVAEFNMVLECMRLMPFYMANGMIQKIYELGMTAIKQIEAQEQKGE